MDEILKSVFLKSGKSGLHVHLMKHESGVKYVRIQQIKSGKEQEVHEVNIHPDLLDELVVKLEEYRGLLITRKQGNAFLDGLQVEELIKRYMKGVPIQDLTIQFDISESDLARVLVANGYPLVDNKIPVVRPKRKRRRK